LLHRTMLLRICAVSDAAFGGVCGAEFGARFGAEDGAGFGAEFNAGFGAEFNVSYGAGFGATSEQSSVPDSKQSSVCAEFGAGFGVGVDAASVQSRCRLRGRVRCGLWCKVRHSFGVEVGASASSFSPWVLHPIWHRSSLGNSASSFSPWLLRSFGGFPPWALQRQLCCFEALLGCFDPSAASLLGLCGGNFAASKLSSATSILRRLPSLGFAAATLLLRSYSDFSPWALRRQLPWALRRQPWLLRLVDRSGGCGLKIRFKGVCAQYYDLTAFGEFSAASTWFLTKNLQQPILWLSRR
jgi:hypothetical protein